MIDKNTWVGPPKTTASPWALSSCLHLTFNNSNIEYALVHHLSLLLWLTSGTAKAIPGLCIVDIMRTNLHWMQKQTWWTQMGCRSLSRTHNCHHHWRGCPVHPSWNMNFRWLYRVSLLWDRFLHCSPICSFRISTFYFLLCWTPPSSLVNSTEGPRRAGLIGYLRIIIWNSDN